MAEGPVSRSLERRFASTPRIVPLVAIVVVGYVGMVAVLIGVGDADRARRCPEWPASVG